MTEPTRFIPNSDGESTPYQGQNPNPASTANPQQGAPTATGFPGGPPQGAPAPTGTPPKPKKPFYKRWWFWVLIVLVALIGIGALSGGDKSDEPEELVVQEEVQEDADEGEPAEAEDEAPAEAAAGKPEGTRENPLPLGSTVEAEEWALTVNSVDLNATEAVLAENQFNDGPAEGNVYILVNVTVQYLGDDPQGAVNQFLVEYVTPEGNTRTTYDSDAMAVAPDAFDVLATLYEGASLSGNLLFSVPADTAAEGVLSVQPEMFSDKTFVAVK